jgi:hypothetical protein
LLQSMVDGYKTELVLYGTTAPERFASLHDWSQPLTQHFIGASFCALLQSVHIMLISLLQSSHFVRVLLLFKVVDRTWTRRSKQNDLLHLARVIEFFVCYVFGVFSRLSGRSERAAK